MNFENNIYKNKEAMNELSVNFEKLAPVITEKELRQYCETEPELTPLVESLLSYSERYAEDVWEMHRMINDGYLETEEGAKEYAEKNSTRTLLHTALVDSIAILSRNLAQRGLDNEWVRELTNGTALERASCGTLALMLVYQRYIDKQGEML